MMAIQTIMASNRATPEQVVVGVRRESGDRGGSPRMQTSRDQDCRHRSAVAAESAEKRGAKSPRDNENNIREHKYTLVFMLDSAAVRTTKFMIPAACRMPESANTRDEGLSVTTFAPVSVHGMMVTTIREGQDIEQKQAQAHVSQGSGNIADRVAGFAGGNGNHLDAVE